MPITIFRPKVMKKLSFLILFVASCFFAHSTYAQIPNARDILNKVFDKISTIQGLYYRLEYKERVFESGKMRHDSSTVKYQKSPRKIYIKMANGSELLWGPDMNGGDVLVHPNSFPFFNVNLNPNGYFIRKNQHHGLDEMGFDYFTGLVKASIDRAGNNFDSHFFYQGELTFNGFKCQEVLLIDPGFKYIPYTVKQGETILTIAHSMWLNEYMILKHNPKVSSYTDVKPGQVILIPSNYAMQVKLYIDKDSMLPVMMQIDDEKGLFEEYEYKELKVNPPFKAEEFSKDNKVYHF
jgi:outer membrane lipoprotein-sorting protein